MNNFRNNYDVRVRALERGLNGINGNITNLTSQLQNNRPPPLQQPNPSSNTSVASEMDDEERQQILDARKAAREQQQEIEQYNTLKKDFYNSEMGEQDNIFINFINEPQIDPRAVRAEATLAEATPIEPVEVKLVAKRTKEEIEQEKRRKQEAREIAKMEEEEREQLRQSSKRGKSLEFSTEEINNATDEELFNMILMLGQGDQFIDNLGGIARGKRTEAKNYIKNAVRQNREERKLSEKRNIEGRKLPQNLFRNL